MKHLIAKLVLGCILLVVSRAGAQEVTDIPPDIDAMFARGDAMLTTNPAGAEQVFDSARIQASRLGHEKALSEACRKMGGAIFYQMDFPRAREQFLKSAAHAKSAKDTIRLEKALHNVAITHYKEASYQDAIETWLTCYELNQASGSERTAYDYMQGVGNAYIHQGIFYKALEYYVKSNEIAREDADTSAMAASFNNIGEVQSHMDQDSVALDYFRQAYDLALKSGDRRSEALSLINMSSSYEGLGELDKSVSNLIEAAGIMRELGSLFQVVKIYVAMGDLYVQAEDTVQASAAYERALALNDSTRNGTNYIIVYSKLSDWLYKLGDPDRAFPMAEKAMAIAEQLNHMQGMKMASGTLAKIYADRGQYEEAYEYEQIFAAYADSLRGKERAETILSLESKFRFDLQEEEIKVTKEKLEKEKLQTELERQKGKEEEAKSRLFMAIGAALLLLFVLLLILVRNKTRHNKKLQIARERAERSEQIKEQFLANTSHEIRTPLHAIKGLAYLLQGKELKEEDAGMVRAIEDASNHMIHVLNDILDVSSLNAGRLHFQNESFNPGELIGHSVKMLKSRAVDKGLEISVDVEQTGIVLGDKARLRQVVLNMVSNAIKYSEQGKVTVKARYDGQLHLSVSDQGKGIAEGDRDRVFGTFERIEEAVEPGVGLGMAISKEIVERQNGRIWFDSIVGVGTTFYVEIPYPLATEAEELKPAETVVDFSGLSFLVVDDNDMSRSVTARILERHGAIVTTVRSGEDCITLCENQQFTHVLLDIEMPGLSGYEVANLINKDNVGMVIGLSAHSDIEMESKVMAAGMSGYVSKPFNPKHLASKVGPSTSSGGQIDLTYLKSITGGDRLQLNKILKEYVDSAQGNIEKAVASFREGDLTVCKSLLHKLKPMCVYVGLKDQAARMESLEKQGLENGKAEAEKELLNLKSSIELSVKEVWQVLETN